VIRGSASVGRPLNEPTGASAPRAVQQLGLTLEPKRFPVGVIVIDRLDRAPSEN
jgi:uncharacterized protein (TIGR03435 family)